MDARKPDSLFTNAGVLLSSRLLIAVLGWAGTVLIVRTLSVSEYGQFTLVFTTLGIVSVLTDLGIGRIAVRGILHGDDRAAFTGNYIMLRSALGLVAYGVVVAFVVVAGYPATVLHATLVAGLVILFGAPGNAYGTVFQAHRRLRGLSLTRVLSRTAQLGLTTALVVAGGSLLVLTIPAVLADLLVLLWVAPAAHRMAPIRYALDLRAWGAMLAEAAPLSAGAALASIYYRADSLLLSKLDGFEAVAFYGIAYKFVDLLHEASTAVNAAILPVLVAAWPDRAEAFVATVRRGATLLALFLGLALVEFMLFAEDVIGLLYGSTYEQAAHAARVVVAADAVAFATGLALIVLVAAGRNRRYPLIIGVGLVLNVALNLALIPAYGYEGAAYATLATNLLVVAWMLREAQRVPGLSRFPRPPLLRIVAAALTAGVVGVSAAWWLPWIPAAVLTALVYLGAVVVLRAAGPQGIRALGHDHV